MTPLILNVLAVIIFLRVLVFAAFPHMKFNIPWPNLFRPINIDEATSHLIRHYISQWMPCPKRGGGLSLNKLKMVWISLLSLLRLLEPASLCWCLVVYTRSFTFCAVLLTASHYGIAWHHTEHFSEALLPSQSSTCFYVPHMHLLDNNCWQSCPKATRDSWQDVSFLFEKYPDLLLQALSSVEHTLKCWLYIIVNDTGCKIWKHLPETASINAEISWSDTNWTQELHSSESTGSWKDEWKAAFIASKRCTSVS